jgi:hypothetical protein
MPNGKTTNTLSDTPTDTNTTADAPQFWSVRSSFPIDRKRRLFRTISEIRARAFIERRFPRGEEAYLESPSGVIESFHAERQGEHGEDASAWAPFDPDTWVPPTEQEPPGQSAWGDVEG